MTTATMNRISFGPAEHDKLRDEACAAMVLAGTPGFAGKVTTRAGVETEFRRPSIPAKPTSIAQQVLMAHGASALDVMRLSNEDLGRIVFGDRNHARSFFGDSFAAGINNVSGMYLNVTLDAADIQLRKAYTETPTTFETWAVRVADIQDFNPANLVSVGAFPDPTAVGEDGEFDEVSTVDGKEQLRLHTWGFRAGVSYRLMVNDTLGAIVGTFAKRMSSAIRRKQNRLIYSILKSNPLMSDAVALFDDSTHKNLTTGAISDYNAAFNTVCLKLGAQTAPGAGASPIGLKAKYVLHPPSQHQTWFELLESPTKIGQANSQVPNMFRGIAKRVEEPELGTAFGGSDTSFYVAGDGNQCEHICYGYLRNENGPVFQIFERPGVLGWNCRMHQSFAAGSADHRNIQKHTGAP